MKIELELPYVDEELSIKITVKKDGNVVVEKPVTAPTPPAPKTQPKKKTTTPAPTGGSNFMNADF